MLVALHVYMCLLGVVLVGLVGVVLLGVVLVGVVLVALHPLNQQKNSGTSPKNPKKIVSKKSWIKGKINTKIVGQREGQQEFRGNQQKLVEQSALWKWISIKVCRIRKFLDLLYPT